MNRATFVETRQGRWRDLEALLDRARTRTDRLEASEIRRLGRLHREVAADLAQARRRFGGDALVDRLETLVGRSRQLVYTTPTRRSSFVDFVVRGYWWEIRRRPRPLLVAALLLFVPMLVSSFWAHANPDEAIALTSASFGTDGEVRSESGSLGLSIGEQAGFAAMIFTNNIRVALTAFAGGISAGILTAVLLVFNGMLGTLAGLMIRLGQGPRFFELVAPHGVLELSLIVVAGAAGLRLGWSAVEPGRLTRSKRWPTRPVAPPIWCWAPLSGW